jgi:torulene dioxygenase
LDTTTTPPQYSVFEVNASGIGSILATIADAPPAYIHSLFSTENYVILIIWQADLGKKTSKPYYNVLDNLKDWDPERETIFCGSYQYPFSDYLLILFPDVIDKAKGGVVAKYTTDTFFAFHEVDITLELQYWP